MKKAVGYHKRNQQILTQIEKSNTRFLMLFADIKLNIHLEDVFSPTELGSLMEKIEEAAFDFLTSSNGGSLVIWLQRFLENEIEEEGMFITESQLPSGLRMGALSGNTAFPESWKYRPWQETSLR